MKFKKYSHPSEKVAALFRPAKARYGYQGDNTPRNVNYATAIELLTEAFGPAITFDDWRQVADVDSWTESMKDQWPGWKRRDGKPRIVPKDTWYFNTSGDFSELYLTSDIQMNYLAMAMEGIEIG